MSGYSQFVHIDGYGVKPRAGKERWSCIAGITAEGARVPNASRHVPDPSEPSILYGVSPIEAGQRALDLAPSARDSAGRHLRCDGVILCAGVASYPVPRQLVSKDPVARDTYLRWRQETIDWLQQSSGEYLSSIVEHSDEPYYHLHFYLVPKVGPNSRLDLPAFHPGRAMKAAAAEAGAGKADQDAAYRRGMERWQDDYYDAVSRHFGHDRYGPRRARLSRREREADKRIEAKDASVRAALDAKRAEEQRKRNEADARMRERFAVMEADARRRGWQAYAQPYADLRAGFDLLLRDHGNERARREAAEAEAAALRARLAAIEAEAGTVMAWR